MRKALETAGVEFTNDKGARGEAVCTRHEAPDTPRGTPRGDPCVAQLDASRDHSPS